VFANQNYSFQMRENIKALSVEKTPTPVDANPMNCLTEATDFGKATPLVILFC